MRDETRFALILWVFLFMVGTCGGLEQNTLTPGEFCILVGIELVTILALLPKSKKRR